MIDFNYTAPELLPFRIQEVLDAPNEPHRIGGVVYVPEGGVECENLIDPWGVRLAEADEQESILTAELDFSVRDEIKRTIDVFHDRREDLY